ncbi:MAG: hypothetical protein GX951_05785 [Mollicutes bacterium]|nr:hypothetical protein [Mollicutes bacterium]
MNNETNNIGGQINSQDQGGVLLDTNVAPVENLQGMRIGDNLNVQSTTSVVTETPVVSQPTQVPVATPTVEPAAPVIQAVPEANQTINPNVVSSMPPEDVTVASVAPSDLQPKPEDVMTVAPAPVNQNITGAQEGLGEAKPKKKGFLTFILILIILGALGVGGYFVYKEFFNKPASVPVSPNNIEEEPPIENEKNDVIQYMGSDFKIPENYEAEIKENDLIFKSDDKMFLLNFYEEYDINLVFSFSNFYNTTSDTVLIDNYTFYIFEYTQDDKTFMPFVIKTAEGHYGLGGICAVKEYAYDSSVFEDMIKIFELNNSANFKKEDMLNDSLQAKYDFVQIAIDAFN